MFEKADLQLYKKIASLSEPSNPELHELYRNYIKVAEVNENIRRGELTGRKL